jgi:UDP-N-acetylmuramate dehydrogenase
MLIQENVSLKPYNTFGVEVSAQYFSEVNSAEELLESLQFSNTQTLPIFSWAVEATFFSQRTLTD